MKMDDLAYIAGLFDGEGSIFVASRSGNRPTLQLRVSLNMVARESIDLVASVFGGGVNCYEKGENRRRQFQWSLSGIEAQNFLRGLRPWLIIKAEEANVALEYPVGQHGIWLSDEERRQQHKIADELKRLKRG